MQQTNEWASDVLGGLWSGTGRWYDDKQWKGRGKWTGGLLNGNWDGIGKWEAENNQMGNWTGKGELFSSVTFPKYVPIVLILSLFIIAVLGLIIAVFSMQFAKEIIGLIVILFLIIILMSLQKTNKGKWQATGTWEDIGDFRILKIQGEWKLGYYRGVLNGEMKDSKKPETSPLQ